MKKKNVPQSCIAQSHSSAPGLAASLALLLLWAAFAPSAQADERLFTYSYEADVLPKGGLEFEQWITHKRGKGSGVYSRWEFREELEYGLTDRLTTALYLNFRDTHKDGVRNSDGEKEYEDSFEFKGISSEWKYQLLSPYTKPVGLLLYGEVTYQGDELELEEKLVLQRNFGEKWVAVFNAVLEQEWEFQDAGTEGELALELTTGLSYRLSPHWALGVEGRNVRKFPDFNSEKSSAWFVGPALHYGTGRWWATLTVLPQIAGRPDTRSGLNLDEHERVEIRLIAGYNF